MAGMLEGKVALVTGASSGIGRATAIRLAAEGAKVVITARREQESLETVKLIEQAGGEAVYVQADAASAADSQRMVEQAVGRFGRLDCAFNNAGTGGGGAPEWTDAPEEAMDTLYGVNLKGVWLSMKFEIPAMLESGGGSIINNSSVLGIRGGSSAAYTATKHAVIGLTRSAALEYAGRGVRINAIAPGVILTANWERRFAETSDLEEQTMRRIPISRGGSVDEIAGPVAWLCSDDSSYVTGTTITIDGGLVEK